MNRNNHFFSRIRHRCPFCYQPHALGGWIFSITRSLPAETLVTGKRCPGSEDAVRDGFAAVVEFHPSDRFLAALRVGGDVMRDFNQDELLRTGRTFLVKATDLAAMEPPIHLPEGRVLYVPTIGGAFDTLYRKLQHAQSSEAEAKDVLGKAKGKSKTAKPDTLH